VKFGDDDGKVHPASFLAGLLEPLDPPVPGQEADARHVIAAAEDGAPWAKRIVAEATEALAQALADARALIDPEVVVLGGGVGLNPSFRRALEAAVATLPTSLRVRLVAAELGADAGLIGAADWARTRLGEPTRT